MCDPRARGYSSRGRARGLWPLGSAGAPLPDRSGLTSAPALTPYWAAEVAVESTITPSMHHASGGHGALAHRWRRDASLLAGVVHRGARALVRLGNTPVTPALQVRGARHPRVARGIHNAAPAQLADGERPARGDKRGGDPQIHFL